MNRYLDYLQSPEWQERRLAKLEQAGYRCEKCSEHSGLSVHHKTYERLGNERSDDLIVLCQSCHWVADEYRKGNTALLPRFYKPPDKSKRTLRLEAKNRKRTAKRWRKKFNEGKNRANMARH